MECNASMPLVDLLERKKELTLQQSVLEDAWDAVATQNRSADIVDLKARIKELEVEVDGCDMAGVGHNMRDRIYRCIELSAVDACEYGGTHTIHFLPCLYFIILQLRALEIDEEIADVRQQITSTTAAIERLQHILAERRKAISEVEKKLSLMQPIDGTVFLCILKYGRHLYVVRVVV